MGKIYVYSTKTYMNPRTIHMPDGDVNYGSWFKIGMTEQDDAEIRVKQQDGTSNPETLITQCIFNGDRYFDLEPYDISAYDAEQHIHDYFREKGREVRVDASREWFECTIEEIREAIQHIIDPEAHKMVLKMNPHQGYDIITFDDGTTYKGTSLFIRERLFEGTSRQILLNEKPRSGKTFEMYEYMLRYNPKNVLCLTNYPLLNNQWINDAKKIKGLNYDFINMSQDEVDEIVMKDDIPNFVMISLQDSKGGEEIFGKKKFDILRDIVWDLLIIDECHKGVLTEKTAKLLNKIKYDRLIGLSATPTKHLVFGTFTKEDIHTYNIVEENKFKKKYPDIYTLPDISYWMYHVPDSVKKEIKYYTEEEQFTWAKFLRVEEGRLVYKNDLRIFFMWIAGYYGGGINSPLKKFDANSILLFVQNTECQSLLVGLLNEIPFYRENYNIHFTNSMVNSDSAKLLEKTKTLFIPRDGKKCLVIANRQLTTGVTMKYCDMVMFMNDWESIDEYIQASFRCQSAMKGKKTCQVIDFTPYRTFNILNRYIENNAVFNGKSLDTNRIEFLNSVTLFESCDNGFKMIDLQAFKERVVDAMDISDKNFFGNYLIRKDQVANDCNWLYEKLGHIESGADKAETRERLDDNDIEKGKTKETYREKSDKKEEEFDKKLLWALENIEYFLLKTPLLSIYSEFKFDNIDDCFNYIHSDVDREKNYVSAISLDGKLNIDFEIAELIDRNYINVDLLNDRILTFNTKIRKLIYTKNKNELVINIQKVLELIDSYVGVSKIEKKLLGEVMTPQPLVREMVATLPEEVWHNPNLKWLEPANGSGVFIAVVVEKLMEGLKNWQPDEELRYKHIIENMIYVCELQPKNMFIYLFLFDPNHEYKMNWYRGSFLEEGFDNKMKEWGVAGFDIILTNPPFQELDEKTGKSKPAGANLWSKFLYKSIDVLKNDGKLLLIHPPAWRSYGNKMLDDIFYKYQLKHLEIGTSKKYFPTTASRFDWYLLIKSKNLKEYTDVFCDIDMKNGGKIVKSEILFNHEIKVIPNLLTSDSISILNKLNINKKLKMVRSCEYHTQNADLKKEKDDEYIYPIIHTVSKEGKPGLLWAKNPHKKQNSPKVVVSNAGYLIPYIDKGEMGITQNAFFVEVKDDIESKLISDLILSKIFKFYLHMNKFSAYFNKVLNTLPYPDIEYPINDEKLYEYFNLTEDEIKIIEETIK